MELPDLCWEKIVLNNPHKTCAIFVKTCLNIFIKAWQAEHIADIRKFIFLSKIQPPEFGTLIPFVMENIPPRIKQFLIKIYTQRKA